jgi:uncharacterized protein YdhG (YjbR/CyaY superfamily)
MKPEQTVPATIDEYLVGFPEPVQARLADIRATIRNTVPEAEEAIKYGMPTFVLHGNLIHFGAYKKHIGLYPAPRTEEQFRDELAAYPGEKGTARFPHDRPLPLDLIARIVRFRAEEQRAKPSAKKP